MGSGPVGRTREHARRMPWAAASALDGSAKDGTRVAARTLRYTQTAQGAILPDVGVFGRGDECILVRLPAAHESGNLRCGARFPSAPGANQSTQSDSVAHQRRV